MDKIIAVLCGLALAACGDPVVTTQHIKVAQKYCEKHDGLDRIYIDKSVGSTQDDGHIKIVCKNEVAVRYVKARDLLADAGVK